MNKLLISLILFSLSFTITNARSSIADSELPYISYLVTRQSATETPYENAYWNNYEDGIYVDIISGVPLFSSRDKYDSDTGWPTFSRTINSGSVIYKIDTSGEEERIEVVSRRSGAHLGHIFDDGPVIYNGVRYCMNSAAMRFIPLSQMRLQGYGALIRFVR